MQPAIDSIRPDSVDVPYGGAVEVTIYGKGFAAGQPGRNTVHFGPAKLGAIRASDDGGRIAFTIPDQIDTGGEAPPSRLHSGSYDIGVETVAGLSNLVSIRVYR